MADVEGGAYREIEPHGGNGEHAAGGRRSKVVIALVVAVSLALVSAIVVATSLPGNWSTSSGVTLGARQTPGDTDCSADTDTYIMQVSIQTADPACLKELGLEEMIGEKLTERSALLALPVKVDGSEPENLDSTTLGKGKKGEEPPAKASGADPLRKVKDVATNFAASAFSACTAEILTMPADTAKVRMQMAGGPGTKYATMLGTMSNVVKDEGMGGLMKGLDSGLHRQILFGGIRLGLYEPVKNGVQQVFQGKNATGEVPLALKCLAGALSGALAMVIASPTELVKVRMQSEGMKLMQTGGTAKYPSALAAYGIIAREEGGIGALWRGLAPNVISNSIINAAELAGYDQTKELLLKCGMPNDLRVHLMAGFGAGVSGTAFGSWADVIKSRVLGDTTGKYKNFFDCLYKTVSQDGIGALYSGFLPLLGRQGGGNLIIFVTLEQTKQFMQKHGLLPSDQPTEKPDKKKKEVKV